MWFSPCPHFRENGAKVTVSRSPVQSAKTREDTNLTVARIVSGGQTGVDRAALDAALGAGFPCGGWCPAGRRAEDGVIEARYPLQETPGREYPERTRANVADSDATLVLTIGHAAGGTRDTIACARTLGKPVLEIDLGDGETAARRLSRIVRWLDAGPVGVLNVAGPRESGQPGIYAMALALMRDLIKALLGDELDAPAGDKG